MANMTVTTKLTDLRTLFNSVKEIYYSANEITAAQLEADSITVDMELPVLDDGVSFDTGAPDVTQIKLTTGVVWTSKASKGDADISFQVASVDGAVNDLLLTNKVSIDSVTGIIDGTTYSGSGYNMSPKKVTGSLMMWSEDRQTVIVLPSVEMYANLVAADGDNPAYFNLTVTPMENSEEVDLMILYKEGN